MQTVIRGGFHDMNRRQLSLRLMLLVIASLCVSLAAIRYGLVGAADAVQDVDLVIPSLLFVGGAYLLSGTMAVPVGYFFAGRRGAWIGVMVAACVATVACCILAILPAMQPAHG